MNAARSPYFIDTNCSNDGSVGLVTSPSQTLPIRMLRGLLLRMPRGICLVVFDCVAMKLGLLGVELLEELCLNNCFSRYK